MKKFLKITGITLLILVVALLTLPFLFQSEIKDLVKKFINQNLNAHVEFSDVNLSLFRSFPQAHVNISDLVITNFEPFKDETFLTAKDISFTLSVRELFKNADDGPITVNSIRVNEALVTLRSDAFGNVNYDITKPDDSKSPSEDASFGFDIDDYSIKNSALTYIDDLSKMQVYITDFNHKGAAQFSDTLSELDTYSEARVTFTMDSSNYLDNMPIKLKALIDMDLNNNIYTFKDNEGIINQLPLQFEGSVALLEDGQDINIRFENPGSSFKDFLAVLPEAYAKDLASIETTGNFKIKGAVEGIMNDDRIPQFDISIQSEDASFKYPDLPKRVENIVINTLIKNETGQLKDTYVDLKTLDFKIDQDVFHSSAHIKNLLDNMHVDAKIDGVLNLANISQAYPIDLDQKLSGVLRADIQTSFDMKAIETNAFDRIKAAGTAKITDFVFTSDAMHGPMNIAVADLTFNPSTVKLNRFEAKTGQSDLTASGSIDNLIGFMLSKKVNLKGGFNLHSNNLVVSDFLADDKPAAKEDQKTETKTTASGPLKIPAFLDCTIQASANSVLYDNLILKDVKGQLVIKDQNAQINNLSSRIFDGLLGVSGKISTQSDRPSFNVELNMTDFDIAQSFTGMHLLESLAPIAKVLQGKLNTKISISGLLNSEMSPDMSTVSGSARANLLTSNIEGSESPLLNQLGGALNFIDFSKIDLHNIQAFLEFNNGKIHLKPIDLAYKDIAIHFSGTHGLDQSLAYNATFDVPAKYLGGDINRLIGKINDNEVNALKIPISANITGNFSNPKIKTDLTSGITNLTQQLIEIEKQKLIGQGKDKIKDFLSGLKDQQQPKPGSGTTPTTSTKDSTAVKTDSIAKPKDPKKDAVKDGVKDILGGLFGNKKKKDSVN